MHSDQHLVTAGDWETIAQLAIRLTKSLKRFCRGKVSTKYERILPMVASHIYLCIPTRGLIENHFEKSSLKVKVKNGSNLQNSSTSLQVNHESRFFWGSRAELPTLIF